MNNKELYKRFIAYLIDYLIVMILVSGLINIKQFNPFYDYMLESNNQYLDSINESKDIISKKLTKNGDN